MSTLSELSQPDASSPRSATADGNVRVLSTTADERRGEVSGEISEATSSDVAKVASGGPSEQRGPEQSSEPPAQAASSADAGSGAVPSVRVAAPKTSEGSLVFVVDDDGMGPPSSPAPGTGLATHPRPEGGTEDRPGEPRADRRRLQVLLAAAVITVAVLSAVLLWNRSPRRSQVAKAGGASGHQQPADPQGRSSSADGATEAPPPPPIPVADAPVADQNKWVASGAGARVGVEGSGIRVSRTTGAGVIVRFAPEQTKGWTDYRVSARVSGLRDDIADGSAALVVLTGSDSPVEFRVDNDRLQLVQRSSDGQEQLLVDKIVPWAASHSVEMAVGQANLLVKLDGRTYFSGPPPARGSQPLRGGIALMARSSAKDTSASFLFDDLRITPLTQR